MPGWSDIIELDKAADEDSEGLKKSSARVNRIIQKELDNGIAPAKIILGGFSQGGALALHTALRSDFSLGGCIALSTWLPLRADYPAAMTTQAALLPILQVHGDRDEVVEHSWGASSHMLLKTLVPNPIPIFETIPVILKRVLT